MRSLQAANRRGAPSPLLLGRVRARCPRPPRRSQGDHALDVLGTVPRALPGGRPRSERVVYVGGDRCSPQPARLPASICASIWCAALGCRGGQHVARRMVCAAPRWRTGPVRRDPGAIQRDADADLRAVLRWVEATSTGSLNVDELGGGRAMTTPRSPSLQSSRPGRRRCSDPPPERRRGPSGC